MADLDLSAQEALSQVNAALAAADEASARMAALRERLSVSEDLLELAFSRLREGAQALLVQVSEEARELMAARTEAVASLEELDEGLTELREQAVREMAETREAVEGLAARAEGMTADVAGLTAAADEADRRLEAKLAEIEQEVGQALSSTESLLRDDLSGELKRLGEAVERVAVELQDYVDGQILPALTGRAQALFDQLVQAEEDLRLALEAASSETETTMDEVLQVCNDTFNEAFTELSDTGRRLEELLDALHSLLEDGRDRLEDDKDEWQGAVRAVERALKEANESLRDIEQLLSQYSFVRM